MNKNRNRGGKKEDGKELQSPSTQPTQNIARGRGRGRNSQQQIADKGAVYTIPGTGRKDNPSTQKDTQKPIEQEISALKLVDEHGQSSTDSKALVAAPKQSEFRYPVRHSTGTNGTPIKVHSNHMELTILPGREYVVQYDVKIEPEKSKAKFRSVVQEFVNRHCGSKNPVYDGRSIIYSYGLLPFGTERKDRIKIITRGEKTREYDIAVKKVAILDLNLINEYYSSRYVNESPPIAVMRMIDIVMRQCSALRCTQSGRSFFSPSVPGSCKLTGGMELWYGSFHSFNLGWKPIINFDVTHKAFPMAKSCLELYRDFESELNIKRLPQHLITRIFGGFLNGLKVEYSIPNVPNTMRVFTINGLASDRNRSTGHISYKDAAFTFFTDKNDAERSVLDYYEKDKNYKIIETRVPLLHVGDKKKRIYVPMELCKVIPGQNIQRDLNDDQTASLIKLTATAPGHRKKKIMDAFKKLALGTDKHMKEFGLSISDQMETIDARKLKPPNVQYKQGTLTPKNATWEPGTFIAPCSISKWAIINLEEQLTHDMLKTFRSSFIKFATAHGCNIGDYFVAPHYVDKNNVKKINECFTTLKKSGVKLLFVVIATKGPIYSTVKTIAEQECGILTQCVTLNTVKFKMNAQCLNNLVQKVNAKLNGINHVLNPRSIFLSIPTMIMGADVTHSKSGSQGLEPSIAAVAASHDINAFCYSTEFRLQNGEVIEDLGTIFKNKLTNFKLKTKHPPRHIIYFRDGVGNGQFKEILQIELQAMRQACASFSLSYKPRITIVLAQKRHHVRFFRTDDDPECGTNVPAGLVVDNCITHPTITDYFLVSHSCTQGVARPTKYCLIHDDGQMTQNELEELTNYLCYLYSRCSKAVSYPVPTYYAHLAAFRARHYLYGKGKVDMNNLDDYQKLLHVNETFQEEHPMFFV